MKSIIRQADHGGTNGRHKGPPMDGRFFFGRISEEEKHFRRLWC